MQSPYTGFTSIWIIVVAVSARPGEQPEPLALAANDISTGYIVEIGMAEQRGIRRPPYPTGPQALLVTIDAAEVVACHLALGWRVPERIVDLMVEFRNSTDSRHALQVGGLAGALLRFGLPAMAGLTAGTAPDQMRRRLEAVTGLFEAMRASLDLGRALLRGRYMCAVARIEAIGIPVDAETTDRLTRAWPAIRERVISIIDRGYGVYRDGHFDVDAFAGWLKRYEIAWPLLDMGRLDLGDDAFREMARADSAVRPLKELRSTLANFDPCALTVGRDGRNRTPLRPFASRTGRNQPSAKASVLGTAAWVRNLIKPRPGMGLALIDWQQQEFGIAAALSGDPAMQNAYSSGDPYFALAVAAGAAPRGATIVTHPDARERFKACALGIQYGMGAARLARQLGLLEVDAREIQQHHRAAFPGFWRWSDNVETHALLYRQQQSVFGWEVAVGHDANPRALRNFPMQANGAEMLRLACCLATEAGITVCAPNHDSLLIEAPIRNLDDAVATTQRLMAEASDVILDGFALRTSVRVIRDPDRWTDQRGQAVWAAVECALGTQGPPAHQRHATCSPMNPRTVLLYVSMGDSSDASD